MVEENIKNFLNEQSEFTDLVESFGWIDLPEKSKYPRVTFKAISKPTLYQSTDRWERWRFYIVAANKKTCADIADVLDDLLNNLYGDVDSQAIDYIARIDEGQMERREDGKYEMYVDFRVLYH